MSINFYDKYLKYKHKYITLSNQIRGGKGEKITFGYVCKYPLSSDNDTITSATPQQIHDVNMFVKNGTSSNVTMFIEKNKKAYHILPIYKIDNNVLFCINDSALRDELRYIFNHRNS
jgi:hypothetical protein